ncbi:LCP family protein [Corynebacterium anserum]|uniref:LytR family transcriptional regulator n=1 Tax=Corynebacterium anserum TaxID=2684406 RepID=A0A7G7YPQ3_9CORY|nr:LCP family protein [Corynebacterium anserum]MBC2682113.1 LytR family transcriptional regulator [Corynebacterium anserum]QNH96473.1 LytR family transcriptional regulator [Corynebacterium anserum]
MTEQPQDTARKNAHTPRHSRHIHSAYPRKPLRQFGSKPVKTVLAALSAFTLLGTGVGYATVGNLNHELAQANGLDLGSQPDGATDILLVGVDSRTDAQGNPLTEDEIKMLRAGDEEATNTDTMILIRIPNDGSSATAVSLPRDTYVSTPDQGNMKLNGVYGTTKYLESQKLSGSGLSKKEIEERSTEAGRKALISSVADLTGIHVDHYAEVGLLGFVLLTDAVGGVDVCLNEAVDEPLSGAKFPKGQQTLDGKDALSFVRQRHELPRGDLDRITRQQAYMASLANHILSSDTLTNPSQINRLTEAVKRSVVLDGDWDIMGMATQMQNLAGGNVRFETIPVTSLDGTGDYGESIVTVDKNQVHKFFEHLAGEDEKKSSDKEASDKHDGDNDNSKIDDFNASDYTIDVLNGGEVPGLAASVGTLAKNYGYRTGEVGNAPESGISESQVNAKDKNDPAARAIARQLGGLKVIEDPSLGDKEISVTLSGTYHGPGSKGPSDAPLQDPNSEFVGTHTEGMKDLDGDGVADSDSSSNSDHGSGNSTSSGNSDVVGTEGVVADKPQLNRPIDAGSNAPMCVN